MSVYALGNVAASGLNELRVDNIFTKDGTSLVENDGGNVSLKNINITSSVGNLPANRNLIINGDFRVNQRGAASRTENTNAYNYDRWYYDGTHLYQGVEDKSVANGTYTLTWVDAGSDITAAYIVSTDSSNNNGPDSGLVYADVSNGGNITVSEGTEYSKHLWIRFGGTLDNLSKVQLVYGPVATPFEHRSYGEELALCQRYFERTYPAQYPFISGTYLNSESYHHWYFKVEKRVTPTWTFVGTWAASPSAGWTSVTQVLLGSTSYFYASAISYGIASAEL